MPADAPVISATRSVTIECSKIDYGNAAQRRDESIGLWWGASHPQAYRHASGRHQRIEIQYFQGLLHAGAWAAPHIKVSSSAIGHAGSRGDVSRFRSTGERLALP